MKWDAEKYDAVKAPQVDAGMELIEMAEVRLTDTILDVGCGTGKLTTELARRAHEGEVIGIEPSEEMLKRARVQTGDFKNISLLLLDAQTMNFSNRFDLVFSNSALQWIEEQEKVIKRIYNSLKKGGRIAFQLPAKKFCAEFNEYTRKAIQLLRLEKAFACWKSPWFFSTDGEYYEMLEKAGFFNIHVAYKDYSLTFPSVNGVLDWWVSAGLRPFLEPLGTREKEYFQYAFAMNFENNRTEKGIELRFKRLFAFAEK